MKHKWVILFLLALSQFLVVLDSAIMNVALPAIQEALHFNDAQLTWVVTAYALTFGGFLMLGGRAADLYGRRKILIIGTVGFALSSLMIGLAQSDIMLIAARAVQGMTAAFMSPAALSILLTTFKEGPERTRALSVWATVAAGGAAVGVFLGGALTQYVGWEWNFFINVPIGLLAAFGIYKFVPAHIKEEKDKNLDLPGAILVTSGLMASVYALSQAGEAGWDGTTIGVLALGLALLAGFIYNESKAKHPLMPLSIFKIRSLAAGNIVMVSVASGMFAMFFFASLYLQNILQYPPAVTGASFLVMPVVLGIVSTLSPRLIGRYGFKSVLVTGLTLLAAGIFWMSFAPLEGVYVLHVLPSFLLMAVGAGLTFVSATIAATSGVPAEESGLASGILNTSQQVGGALGLSILSAVATIAASGALEGGQATDQATLDGYTAAFSVAGFFILFGLAIAILVIKTKPGKPNQAGQVSLH
jgi:EmrB/QacA subfamily drug resistance transporter